MLCHDFPSNVFRLTVPKHFVEEPFSAVFQKVSESEKVYGKEGGRGKYRNFPPKIVCLTVPKHFVEEPLCAVFQRISGSEKVYG